ncbi:hypothetical protein BM536_013550 [Streptomyces phaeoluteigriseus]|uniref:Uncharacterized protein n=1 Tax=Streptomyces phaeoluteigriseus TaxID=114686 RepID=A0A1V6MTG9_9ACTN|nr:hypothetical protein BM536_013550 [Streptomyces phaeoluteigriseus]
MVRARLADAALHVDDGTGLAAGAVAERWADDGTGLAAEVVAEGGARGPALAGVPPAPTPRTLGCRPGRRAAAGAGPRPGASGGALD